MSLSDDAYAVVLADLRAKRDEIDAAIRAIEAVRPFSIPVAAPQPERPVRGALAPFDTLSGMSIEDGARAVLRQRGQPMRPPEIAEAFREGGLAMNSVQPGNTVSSVLHRGWRNGSDVVLVKRGTWGLAEWYPDQDMSFRANGEGSPEEVVFEGVSTGEGHQTDSVARRRSRPESFGKGVNWTPELINEFSQDRQDIERRGSSNE